MQIVSLLFFHALEAKKSWNYLFFSMLTKEICCSPLSLYVEKEKFVPHMLALLVRIN